jgi:O-antigen/teichoic acid export membrane protein
MNGRAALARALPKSAYARRMLTLSGGTTASQLIVVAASPLLTRIYTPAEFGMFAVLGALISILAPVTALRFELAILAARDEAEARSLAALAVLAACAVSASTVAVLIVLEALPGIGGRLVDYGTVLWLLPPAMLAYAWAQTLASLMMQAGAFTLSSLTMLAQSATQVLSQIVLGLGGFGPLGMALGHIGGNIVRLAWLGACIGPGLRDLARAPGRLQATLKEHWRYPAFSTPSSLLQLAAQFSPAVLITVLYGPAVGGLFALGQRALSAPVRMIGYATSQVFLAEAARRNPDELRVLFGGTVARFFLVGLLWTLPLALVAPRLFEIVFGPSWRAAGEMVQILMPAHLARFVHSPISQVLNVLRRQDLDLALSVGLLSAVLVSFLGGHAMGLDAMATLGLYSGGAAVAYALLVPVAWRLIRDAAPAPLPSAGAA